MVLDADYGVVIPYTLAQLQSRPDLVARHYSDFPTSLPVLQRIYADGWTETASPQVFAEVRDLENEAERLKWLSLAVCLWLSVAVFDAGFCLQRMRKHRERHGIGFRLAALMSFLSPSTNAAPSDKPSS